MPVMSSGRTVGAVYVCESDSERAALIGSIQRRLATITIGIGAAALVVLWFSIKMLTRRITQLADGVRTVQRGDYSFRLTLAGDDELTELGQRIQQPHRAPRDDRGAAPPVRIRRIARAQDAAGVDPSAVGQHLAERGHGQRRRCANS